MQAIKSSPAVFLDRDGVLIKDHGYVHKVDDVEVFNDVVDGLIRLKEQGYLLLVVTNQSGVAREYFTLEDVHNCHLHLETLLGPTKLISKYYICPHHPKGSSPVYGKTCDCRKPEPGMIDQALKDFSIDLSRSFIIGDKISDIECGRARGVKGVQIDRGQYPVEPKASVVACFKEAVDLILS